ncbi:monocarboxylate permease [Cordyceps javanica]|uniref:Monocarboxylate permease n=1 Tax=Cordyceps javanica TaxID=43265 RepID=A0A545UMH8_9HYPO|nr:monocarboxylate permease [Cordyceps javanica]
MEHSFCLSARNFFSATLTISPCTSPMFSLQRLLNVVDNYDGLLLCFSVFIFGNHHRLLTWYFRGILNTFGAYQTYYETGALYTASSSNISWIGSLQSSLLLVLGLVTGPLYDAGHFHALLYGGSFLILLGQMMLSLCREYYQALLAQGFCIGIGVGLIFIPSVALLSTYFSTKLAVANGIAAAGSGLGT